jgi:hypothetical protein
MTGTTRAGLAWGACLARRLVESGARFIEVTTEYEPFKHWDTHENGHTRQVDLKKMIDAPIAQLVLDLEARGLLDRTLIVLASEFSRDMVTEGKPGKVVKDQVEVPKELTEMKHYGMHRHFTDAGSVLMIGGGMKRGFLYGEDGGRAARGRGEGSHRNHRPARHALHRDGYLAQAELRDREAAVLHDQGWPWRQPRRPLCLKAQTPGRVQVTCPGVVFLTSDATASET